MSDQEVSTVTLLGCLLILIFGIVAIVLSRHAKVQLRYKMIQPWLEAHGFKILSPMPDGTLVENTRDRSPFFRKDQEGWTPLWLGLSNVDNQELIFGYVLAPFIYIQGHLQKGIPGSVFIKRYGAEWPGGLSQIQLEWIAFNEFIHVFAEPKQLAYEVMDPQVMEWYKNLKRPRPMIYIKNNQLCVFVDHYPTQQVMDDLYATYRTVYDLLDRRKMPT
jgi:hypothetical protein